MAGLFYIDFSCSGRFIIDIQVGSLTLDSDSGNSYFAPGFIDN